MPRSIDSIHQVEQSDFADDFFTQITNPFGRVFNNSMQAFPELENLFNDKKSSIGKYIT